MKKIGILKLGTIPQIVNVAIDQVVHRFERQNDYVVTGIQEDAQKEANIEHLSFNGQEQAKRLCSISNSAWKRHGASMVNNLDILFVFYNEKELAEFNFELLTKKSVCRVLLIPINLFDSQESNLYQLGFDSAINEVVKSIYKVKDTAGSLLLSKKRLFLIEIPGEKAGVFIKAAAKALECEYLADDSKNEFHRITRNIAEKYEDGYNYALLLFNGTIKEENIKNHIYAELNVDFRSVMIEEGQCIGGNPTVIDRVYAIELGEKMANWADSTGQLHTVRLEKIEQIKFGLAH